MAFKRDLLEKLVLWKKSTNRKPSPPSSPSPVLLFFHLLKTPSSFSLLTSSIAEGVDSIGDYACNGDKLCLHQKYYDEEEYY
jgi:hypothetical protein